MSEHDALVRYLVRRHGVHTVILYGSRATGTHTDASDYDVLALRSGDDERLRDVSVWRGSALDAFIEPDSLGPEELWLRCLEGVVLLDAFGHGARLLRRLRALARRGPVALRPDEHAAVARWLERMLVRTSARGVRAQYRRAALLAEALPLWFRVRDRWFPGPMRALDLVAREAPAFREAYERALLPSATHAALVELVALIRPVVPATPARAVRPRTLASPPTRRRSPRGPRAR